MSRILRLEPASQPQNLRAEPEKLERVTYRSNLCNGLARPSDYFFALKWTCQHRRSTAIVADLWPAAWYRPARGLPTGQPDSLYGQRGLPAMLSRDRSRDSGTGKVKT